MYKRKKLSLQSPSLDTASSKIITQIQKQSEGIAISVKIKFLFQKTIPKLDSRIKSSAIYFAWSVHSIVQVARREKKKQKVEKNNRIEREEHSFHCKAHIFTVYMCVIPTMRLNLQSKATFQAT